LPVGLKFPGIPAIPLLFANAFLATLSRQVVQLLDEQSTGLLAESIEKRHG